MQFCHTARVSKCKPLPLLLLLLPGVCAAGKSVGVCLQLEDSGSLGQATTQVQTCLWQDSQQLQHAGHRNFWVCTAQSTHEPAHDAPFTPLDCR
jgi:hypothetical protein